MGYISLHCRFALKRLMLNLKEIAMNSQIKKEEINDENSRMLILTGSDEKTKVKNPEKNIVYLEGIVASDPFPKQFSNGNKLALFTMSHFNNYMTKAGEQVRITEWFQVVSWNKVADLVINTVRKGSRVRLKGKLRSTMWKDESGFYHRRVQIVATEMKQAA